MEGLVMAGQLLVGLGLLVFIHELGHFLAARAFGIRVEKFYIFFDFGGWKVFSKKIGGTEYGIGWFPLGGYVKIAGMIDESMDKNYQDKPAQPWEFRSKPAWQRFIVMIGGITMNIFLGIIIFAFFLMRYRQDYIPPSNISDGIYAYELGRKMGLESGDKILEINGKAPQRASDFNSLKVFFGAKLTVSRNGETRVIDLPDTLFTFFKSSKDYFIGPQNFTNLLIDTIYSETASKAGLKGGDYLIAANGKTLNVYGKLKEITVANAGKSISLTVARGSDTLDLNNVPVKAEDGTIGFGLAQPYETKPYTFINSLYFGTKDGFEAIWFNAVGLLKIFTGKIKFSESVQGPIAMAKNIYGGKWIWERFWYFTGLISFILAFMNILPIPALDGGHVMFIFYEVIRGKPVSDKVLERAQVVGMVLLLALMTYVFGNDIYRNFIK